MRSVSVSMEVESERSHDLRTGTARPLRPGRESIVDSPAERIGFLPCRMAMFLSIMVDVCCKSRGARDIFKATCG